VIGLFGGAFDPPHTGHVALATRAIEHFGLERLIVLPTGVAPHKSVRADAETRLRLARAAFADVPRAEVSRWELDRDGPSYTVETVRQWPGSVLVIGADQFADFLTWHKPNEVLEHARLGVATRSGYERAELERVRSRLARPERVEFFELEPVPVSSRQIRALVARGEAIDGLVPPRVREEIARSNLYGEG
jgi:nicotinate-nucleotide adenylyltransferase